MLKIRIFLYLLFINLSFFISSVPTSKLVPLLPSSVDMKNTSIFKQKTVSDDAVGITYLEMNSTCEKFIAKLEAAENEFERIVLGLPASNKNTNSSFKKAGSVAVSPISQSLLISSFIQMDFSGWDIETYLKKDSNYFFIVELIFQNFFFFKATMSVRLQQVLNKFKKFVQANNNKILEFDNLTVFSQTPLSFFVNRALEFGECLKLRIDNFQSVKSSVKNKKEIYFQPQSSPLVEKIDLLIIAEKFFRFTSLYKEELMQLEDNNWLFILNSSEWFFVNDSFGKSSISFSASNEALLYLDAMIENMWEQISLEVNKDILSKILEKIQSLKITNYELSSALKRLQQATPKLNTKFEFEPPPIITTMEDGATSYFFPQGTPSPQQPTSIGDRFANIEIPGVSGKSMVLPGSLELAAKEGLVIHDVVKTNLSYFIDHFNALFGDLKTVAEKNNQSLNDFLNFFIKYFPVEKESGPFFKLNILSSSFFWADQEVCSQLKPVLEKLQGLLKQQEVIAFVNKFENFLNCFWSKDYSNMNKVVFVRWLSDANFKIDKLLQRIKFFEQNLSGPEAVTSWPDFVKRCKWILALEKMLVVKQTYEKDTSGLNAETLNNLIGYLGNSLLDKPLLACSGIKSLGVDSFSDVYSQKYLSQLRVALGSFISDLNKITTSLRQSVTKNDDSEKKYPFLFSIYGEGFFLRDFFENLTQDEDNSRLAEISFIEVLNKLFSEIPSSS